MTWWEALLLGVVQGLTEFFPVSSSGHLVMVQEVLGITVQGIAFEIVVHVATLISVLIVYRARVLWLFRGLLASGEESTAGYALRLVLASVPAALVFFLAGDWVEAQFDDPAFSGAMLLVTGSFLWSTRWARGRARPGMVEVLPILAAAGAAALFGQLPSFLAVGALVAVILAAARLLAPAEWHEVPTWGGAVAMGVAQSVALFPGISRAGSTVVAGLWRRFDAVAAAEFSFLMSVIAVAGAAVLKIPDAMEQGFGVGPVPLAVGFVASAVSGVLAIRFFVAMLRNQSFYNFAWYCWVVAVAFLWSL